MLSLVNLTKMYSQGLEARPALSDLTLKLAKGEFVSIIGSNGAGKSSLLKAICGELALDSGKILLNNHSLEGISPHKRAKYIGRVFQDPNLGTVADMTVSENLVLSYLRGKPARFKISPNDNLEKVFKERLALLEMGLENRLDQLVGSLSGGQRQALSLVMATLTTPDLLLLDEHCSALDPKSAQKIMMITDKMVKQLGITTLMVTHNMRDALHYGSRLIMLHQGKVVHDYDADQKTRLNLDIIHDFFEIL
jgi:putative ABC transport system ATP-binding protein